MSTNSPPTCHTPMANYPPVYDERPSAADVTLFDIHNLMLDLLARQTRVETRLVKLMREHNLDANGDPLAD